MKMLSPKAKNLDLKSVIYEFCDPCILGKQKKGIFKKMSRPQRKLELVHSYLYGPTSVYSVGGSMYYVTFTDEYIRKV